MKNIRNYENFINQSTNEEINLKKIATGVALGAGLAFGSPVKSQNPTQTHQVDSVSANKWSKVDSVSKNKAQIYSDTKMFIADTWKSAQNVIQNDDKESGMILVKGMTKQTCGKGLSAYSFWYSYTVKFLMKDGKYKIVVDNVQFDVNSNPSMWSNKKLDIQDTYPGVWKAGIYEGAWNDLMTSLKSEMKSIVDRYDKYIKYTNSSDNDGF